MKTANNPKNSDQTRQLAKEALDALQETIREYNNPSSREETTSRIVRTFGFEQLTSTDETKV